MENIIKQLHEGNFSCVIENGGMIRTFAQRGVADLYDLSKTDLLSGAAVADKVAAALMIQGGVREVYADLISESAYALLADVGVEVSYAKIVHHIENRDKTDWCPLECGACETRCPFGVDVIDHMHRAVARFGY